MYKHVLFLKFTSRSKYRRKKSSKKDFPFLKAPATDTTATFLSLTLSWSKMSSKAFSSNSKLWLSVATTTGTGRAPRSFESKSRSWDCVVVSLPTWKNKKQLQVKRIINSTGWNVSITDYYHRLDQHPSCYLKSLKSTLDLLFSKMAAQLLPITKHHGTVLLVPECFGRGGWRDEK